MNWVEWLQINVGWKWKNDENCCSLLKYSDYIRNDMKFVGVFPLNSLEAY
jgi:hypothetical protein